MIIAAVILLILWLVALISNVGGQLIHLVLLVAIILMVINFILKRS